MDVIYPRCCGLDGHKREVVACVVTTDPDGTPFPMGHLARQSGPSGR
jgi:hypothetical protein